MAKKSLLIVESPAKAKTIQKYLGKDYEVMASKGHIKDLPKSGGVDIEKDFQETYKVLEEKGKPEIVKAIREQARQAERVLLATDPDREGEAIAWHLYEEIKGAEKDKPVERVLFNEITKKGVAEGLSHPRALDKNLYEAQRTRRVLDRIGGYPLSSLLWKKLAYGLSAGRVQTPALRIIVDRHREIEAFVPQDFWLIETTLLGKNKPQFTAALESINGEKLERVSSRPSLGSEIDASNAAEALKKATYKVAKISRREQRRKAPAPYTTSKLQQDASNRLSMPPKRAMSIAQGLYEGVHIGKGAKSEQIGLITYMRTDSTRISPDAITECREYIAKKYGKASVPSEPNLFKSGKNAQDAHEAIRPTSLELDPESIRGYLKDEQFRLYKLIWDRFIACQMVPAVYDQTSVDIEADAGSKKYGLRASGSILKDAGWRAVYGATSEPLAGEEAEAKEDDDEGKNLPELSEGEALKLIDPPGVVSEHKQTEPPPYFNEASLVKKLEEEGIGRPSTYAEIISKVQARDYVRKIDNKLKPTPLGILVIDRLVRDKFDLADIGFTRKLEEDLDAVAEAKVKRLDVLRPFHERLQGQIAHANEDKAKWWPPAIDIKEACPECKKPLEEKWGKNGPFIGCTGYPDCSYTRSIPQDGEEEGARDATPTDYDCKVCGAKMLKRWGRNGWFLGCSKYPECKSTRNMPIGIPCPKCGGDIIEVRAKRGRPFYGCENYKAEKPCDFRVWAKPVAEPCPKCKAPFLVRAKKRGQDMMRCVTEGCGFEKVDMGPSAGSGTGENTGGGERAA